MLWGFEARGLCRGLWWRSRGLFTAQYWKFCLFTVPDRWKCTSSLHHKAAVGGTCWRISSDKVLWVSQSVTLNYCATVILYGCILRFAWRIRLTVRSEIPKAAAYFWAECLGDCSIDARIHCTFSDVLTFRGWPLGFLGNADPLAFTFKSHRRIVFRSGMASVAWSLKCVSNALCVAITESFLKNTLIMKPRCSLDQLMVSTDN